MKTQSEIIILDLLNPLINLRIFMSLISILENNLNSTLFLGHLHDTMLCSILVGVMKAGQLLYLNQHDPIISAWFKVINILTDICIFAN